MTASNDSKPSRIGRLRPHLVDARRLERKRWKLLYVKEVLALQMRITLGIARIDGGHCDGSLDARVCVIGFVQGQHSRNCCELPLHIGDHHVFDLEFGHGMGRMKVVVAVCGIARVPKYAILSPRLRCVITIIVATSIVP